MNNFRFYVILLMLGLIPGIGMSQVYNTDITSGGVATNSPTPVGDTLEISFNVVNYGSSNAHSIPVNDALVVMAFPKDATGVPQYYEFAYVENPTGAYFTWTYDATENAIVGVNHTAIPRLGNENVLVKLEAIAATPTPTPYSVLNLQTATADNNPINNDFLPQPVIVPNQNLSLTGIDFISRESECRLDLDISTSKESNLEKLFVEVYNSSNSFETAQEIELNGTPSKYNVKLDVEPGQYIVKLKAILDNGEAEYSQAKFVKVACGDRDLIELLENPIKHGDLRFGGLKENDDVVIYDLQGKIIYSETIQHDDQIKLHVDNLSAAMYVVLVKRDQFVIFEKKFMNRE